MKKKLSFRSLALGAVLLGAAGIASAGVINFSSGMTGLNNTNLGNGSGYGYTFTGTGLTAYALTPSTVNTSGWSSTSCANTASSPCLFYKYTSGTPSETGLGLTGGTSGNNEIYWPNGIGLETATGYISGLELGSVQAGESWQVLGCDSRNCSAVLAGGIGMIVTSGNGVGSNDTMTLSGLAPYLAYIVTVPCADNVDACNPSVLGGSDGTYTTDYPNNILLMSVTTVPEPGTLALFAAGLLGCGLFATRRCRARQS